VEATFKIAPRRRSSIPGRSKAVSAVSAATLTSIISNCLEEAVAPASDGARTGDPIPVDQTRTAIGSSRDRAVSALLIVSLRSREWPGARIDHNFANIFPPAGWLR